MFIGFLPKLVHRSALISPLSVPNFSPIRARIRVLWRILRSVRNEEEVEDEEEKECIAMWEMKISVFKCVTIGALELEVWKT